MKNTRIVVHSITKGNIPFDQVEYSAFKHSTNKIANKYARELADVLLNTIADDGRRILIYGAPFNNVKTASTILADKVAFYMTTSQRKAGVATISRQHSYHDDYGSMDKDKRDASLSGESFAFRLDPKNHGNCHFVFIDDIYITGAHERRVLSLVESAGLNMDDVYFAYYAKLDCPETCPKLESQLNMAAFKKPADVIRHYTAVLNTPFVDDIFNTRSIKHLFRQRQSMFKSIVDHYSIHEHVLRKLVLLVQANDYHTHKLYKKNYDYLISKLN